MRRFLYLTFFILPLNFSSYAVAQTNTITLTSYYPAPIGAYDRLRLVPHADLSGDCDDGSLYFRDSDNTFQICTGNIWGPLSSFWSKTTQAPGFDPYNLSATVDQYYLKTSYPDLTIRKPYIGIGTKNPKGSLHITVDDPGTPETLFIDNLATTHGSGGGPGANISFRGVLGGNPFNEYVDLRVFYTDLTNASAASYLKLYLRDTTGNEKGQAIFTENGFLGIRAWSPYAVLHLAGNAAVSPAIGANTLPYLMISTNTQSINNGNVFAILPNGKVGINQPAPLEQLEIFGKIKATGLILTSDAKLKKNVMPVTNALEKISQLNGISFEWKDSTQQIGQQKHLGILAQNAKQVFPEIVYGNTNATGVDYPALIAPLIEAVKELKQKNEILKKQFRDQSLQINAQEQKVKSLQNSFPAPKLTLKSRGVQ